MNHYYKYWLDTCMSRKRNVRGKILKRPLCALTKPAQIYLPMRDWMAHLGEDVEEKARKGGVVTLQSRLLPATDPRNSDGVGFTTTDYVAERNA